MNVIEDRVRNRCGLAKVEFTEQAGFAQVRCDRPQAVGAFRMASLHLVAEAFFRGVIEQEAPPAR